MIMIWRQSKVEGTVALASSTCLCLAHYVHAGTTPHLHTPSPTPTTLLRPGARCNGRTHQLNNQPAMQWRYYLQTQAHDRLFDETNSPGAQLLAVHASMLPSLCMGKWRERVMTTAQKRMYKLTRVTRLTSYIVPRTMTVASSTDYVGGKWLSVLLSDWWETAH